MCNKILLNKFVDIDYNFSNYDLINLLKLLNTIYTPHTHLTSSNKFFKHAALGAKYQESPPGFEEGEKTANAVSNTNMANADTGATGSYIATQDINCLHNVKPCTLASTIAV